MAGDSKNAASKEFKVLTEEEIEKLTPDERTKYDELMKEKERKEQEGGWRLCSQIGGSFQ